MRSLVLVALAILATALPAEGKDPGPVSEAATQAAVANNQFGIDLYQRLDGDEGNLFFSPYSISSALAMVAEGAKGSTREQIDDVFHLPAALSESQRDLRKALTPKQVNEYRDGKQHKVDSFAMNVANAAWVQEGYLLERDYVHILMEYYGAPPQVLDFRQTAAAREAINDWVEKQTKDRIKDIVPEGMPSPDTRLTLANAIHFKANWMNEFQERWTKKAPFHKEDGDVEVDMMHRVGNFGYLDTDAAQVLEMYYKGGDTSMVVVLPKAKDGLGAVETTLTWDEIQKWLDALKNERTDVKFPRFEFTVPTDLTTLLAQMGMPDAFDADQADFSGMVRTEPLFIGAVLHKAFVAVDEKGTEAAAATVVMMRAGSAPPSQKPKAFVADHPFLFMIRHRPTGAVLFMGRISDPTAG